jgi:tetratricopeptide (TPR) repeat protein
VHLKISRELDLNQTLEKQIEKELSDFGFIAESNISQGDLQLAENILNKVLDFNPNSVSGLIYYSILQKTKKSYFQAIPILERLRTLNPNNQKIKFELADNYALAGQFDQSLNLYNQMIISVQEAKKIYVKNSSNSNAGLAFDRELLKVYVGLANLYFDNGKFAESIENYNKAKEIPDLKEEYFVLRLAEAYFNIGSVKESFSAISYGVKLNPKNLGYSYFKGYIFFKEKDFKNAIINFSQSSTDLDYRDNSNYYLGLINYINLNYEQAYRHFKLVKNNSEFSENALDYSILISTKLGLYDDSKSLIDELTLLYKDKPNNLKFQSILLAQKALVVLKEDKVAMEELEEQGLNLLKDEPNNSRLLYSISLLNLKKGNETMAYNYLDRALRTKQLYEADLYIDKLFQIYDDRKIRKLIKDYF